MEKTIMELNYGSGYGSGDGYGSGYGDGSGYGYGSGYGDGYGYGDGSGYGEFTIPKDSSLTAYHYIADGLIMRGGRQVQIGEHIHEDKIIMCKRGLHASLDKKDAINYAPHNAVLTKVKVWGNIILEKDKLVSTDRMIVEVLQ